MLRTIREGEHIYIIDLFAGAGGTTTGAEQAGAKVIFCVNHDEIALKSHELNHPNCIHYPEDIRTVDTQPIIEAVKRIRARDKNAYIILWASLECTNFSKAKGGLPKDADSRTLAEHLDRYIKPINPDAIYIENVVEFQAWGPLDEFGKPINRKNGTDFIKWINHVCDFGYKWERKELNSADYGAYTSRNRLFIQFVRPNDSFCWPKPTHSKKPSKDIFGELKPWKAVKHCLDFQDSGVSIFARKKPLSEKTLERIYSGLIKYVAGGKEAFLSKYYSGKPQHKNISIEGPAGAIKTIDAHAIVSVDFLKTYYTGGVNHHSIDSACPTLRTKDTVAKIAVESWMDKTYTGQSNHQSIEKPSGTILTNDKHQLVQAYVMINHSQGKRTQSVEEPSGSILTVPKQNLVCLEPWVMNTSFENVGFSVDQPSHTITANRKHFYLMNPQYNSAGNGIDNPCFTLIARMDKMPPYLVEVSETLGALLVFDDDSPMTVKIKEFMALYGLCDIKMRMLRVNELLKIQGFPEDYILLGTQADQKKFIGNSVEVNCCEALIKSRIVNTLKKTA
ncbi:MAG: DNA cytosine methyltransferase [Bacteroidetes bacterium]|nr:MAG: DNA cytosine methyltransferase [Bacteroidota bacterium]